MPQVTIHYPTDGGETSTYKNIEEADTEFGSENTIILTKPDGTTITCRGAGISITKIRPD